MGVNITKTLFEVKKPVHFVLEFISATEVPKTDILSESDPYLRACLVNSANNAQVSEWTKTPVCWNTRHPVWHSYRDLGLTAISNEHSVLVELWDAENFTHNEFIGRSIIPIEELVSDPCSFPITIKPDLATASGTTCTVLLRRVIPVEEPKTLFLIRHGQSLWNQARADLALHRMVSQVDHPLTSAGVQQAREFAGRWQQACDARFTAAQTVFSSPMTRALQTAIVGLQGHPSFVANGITLLPRSREIKKTFAMDTVGVAVGEQVLDRTCALLKRVCPDSGVRRDELKVDDSEVQSAWWTPLHSLDSEQELAERIFDFLCRIRYSPASSSILVGHSLFFRELLRRHMRPSLRSSQPQLTQQLLTGKVCNTGCLRLLLEWDSPLCITDVELLFGSSIVTRERVWACGADKP